LESQALHVATPILEAAAQSPVTEFFTDANCLDGTRAYCYPQALSQRNMHGGC
jgi:hypothetical protein